MTRALVCLALAGCFTDTTAQAIFVRDAHVEGYTLVVQKCWVGAHDDSLVIRECHDVEQRIPVLVVRPAEVAPGPTSALMDPADEGLPAAPDRPEASELARALAPARHQLADCAAASHMTGVTRVHITIDPAGRATAVVPEAGDSRFASCLEHAVDAIAFPPSREGAKIAIAVQGAP